VSLTFAFARHQERPERFSAHVAVSLNPTNDMIMSYKVRTLTLSCALIATSIAIAQVPVPSSGPPAAGARRDPTQSPASQPRPKSSAPQIYPAEQVKEGAARFASQCGFCHGRDATGGESGPDLTRSTMVAEDTRGDKLLPFLRVGRPDKGMPAYDLPADDLNAMTAFIHSQMDKFATLGGGRRSVEPEDLRTGTAAAGKAYFNGAGKCSGCHSPTGDLAGVATRYQGLALLRRMLSPSGNPAPKPAKATLTLASGEKISGSLASEDEFSITILDSSGARRKYQKDAVKVEVDDPLSAHFVQLGKYTDSDMHNVYAYLETLK
jgi:cytochrome c oxidase cbb3-type subunit III